MLVPSPVVAPDTASEPALGLAGAVFGWATMRLRFGELGDYVIGTYAGNNDYLGPGTPLGLMAGIDFPIVRETLYFMVDYVSGTSESSVGVVGLVVELPLGFQISAGLQFPSPLSANAFAGVLELTRIPFLDEAARRRELDAARGRRPLG